MVAGVVSFSKSGLASDLSVVELAAEEFWNAYLKGNAIPRGRSTDIKRDVIALTEEAFGRSTVVADIPPFDVEAVKDEFAHFLVDHRISIPLVPKTKSVVVISKPAAFPVKEAPVSLAKDRSVEVNRPPSVGRQRKLRPMVNGHELPKNVGTLEDAITMNWILCLEDGKRVKDLTAHLVKLGISPDEYRKKWGLSASYPMLNPQTILQRGATFEVEFATGQRRRVRH